MFVLTTIASLYVLWIFYLATMSLTRAFREQTLSKTAYVLGTPIILVAYVIDVIVNITIFTLVFLELPRELTLSHRFTRILFTNQPSWRKSIAQWFCKHLLDTFDPTGKHCE